jgi:hypothetical protein
MGYHLLGIGIGDIEVIRNVIQLLDGIGYIAFVVIRFGRGLFDWVLLGLDGRKFGDT